MDEFKRSSGRPKLKEGKKCRKIDARFTQEEYDLIVSLEKELGVSKTELLRMRVLSDAGKIVINAKLLLKQIDGIGAEMGRCGNNINQLAKHVNFLDSRKIIDPTVTNRYNGLLEEYISIQQALEISLRKIIRSMGK